MTLIDPEEVKTLKALHQKPYPLPHEWVPVKLDIHLTGSLPEVDIMTLACACGDWTQIYARKLE